MPVIKNVNPMGGVDVPLLRCQVEAGAEVTVTEDQAAALLPQATNWEPVDDSAKAIVAEQTAPAEPVAEPVVEPVPPAPTFVAPPAPAVSPVADETTPAASPQADETVPEAGQ